MKRILIAVGVNTYQNGIPGLNWAVSDALAIASFFEYKLGYDKVVPVVLPEDQSASKIKELIKYWASTLGRGDLLVLYFAGHGKVLSSPSADAHLLLLPGAYPDLLECYDESLDLRSIVARMARPGLARWLIIDACRMATSIRTRDYGSIVSPSSSLGKVGFMKGCRQLVEAEGGDGPLWVLNSCGDNEVAMECSDLGGGLFAKALLRVLSRSACMESEECFVRELKGDMCVLASTYDLVHAQTPTLSMSSAFPRIWGLGVRATHSCHVRVVDDVRGWDLTRLQSEAAGLVFELGRRRALASDWEVARSHFRQAGDLGHVAALAMLGQCLSSGQGGPKDPVGAEACFRRALAVRPLPGAMNNLGVLLGRSSAEERQNEAGSWFLAAAEMGHAKGMLNYALYLVCRDPQASGEAALRWARTAEAAGYSEAVVIFQNFKESLLTRGFATAVEPKPTFL